MVPELKLFKTHPRHVVPWKARIMDLVLEKVGKKEAGSSEKEKRKEKCLNKNQQIHVPANLSLNDFPPIVTHFKCRFTKTIKKSCIKRCITSFFVFFFNHYRFFSPRQKFKSKKYVLGI